MEPIKNPKYGTVVFTRCISGLCQQDALPPGKKDALLKSWAQAIREGDRDAAISLATEVKTMTDNRYWLSQISEVLETI